MKMLQIKLLTLITCTTLLGCSVLKQNENIEFVELSYGTIKASGSSIRADKSRKSASGNTVKHHRFQITSITDTITGEVGRVFGVNFKIKAPETKIIAVKRTWTFPKEIEHPTRQNTKSVSRVDEILTNSERWMYYTIEDDFEIVKGKWTLQYFHKGREIYAKTFVMI